MFPQTALCYVNYLAFKLYLVPAMPNSGAKSIFLSILITIFVMSFLAYSENLLTYKFMLAIHQIEPPIVFAPISEANLSRASIVIGGSGTSIKI
jgi:hypothetical protein